MSASKDSRRTRSQDQFPYARRRPVGRDSGRAVGRPASVFAAHIAIEKGAVVALADAIDGSRAHGDRDGLEPALAHPSGDGLPRDSQEFSDFARVH